MRARSWGEFRACQRSVRRWALRQNFRVLPKTRARMRAVGAVTARRSRQSLLASLRGTPHGAGQGALGEGHGVDEFVGEDFADGCRITLCGEHGLHSCQLVLMGYDSLTHQMLT